MAFEIIKLTYFTNHAPQRFLSRRAVTTSAFPFTFNFAFNQRFLYTRRLKN